MATTNGTRKILDLKRWEMCCPTPIPTTGGTLVSSSNHYRQHQLLVASNSQAWLYKPEEDGFVQVPSPALAGTFGPGATACASSVSTGATVAAQSLTATAGTTTSITTNQNFQRDIRGYSVRILAGPNAGQTFTIARNTIGANGVITIATTAGVAFDATTVYQLLTPRWYVLSGGTLAAGAFKVYDFATNTWQSLSITTLPVSLTVDSKLVATPSWLEVGAVQQGTGTASAGGASTLTNSAKAWTTNQWTNSQLRIISGTGAGQIRTIASNTATVLTVSVAWTTAPDATSVYEITGNDDFLYLFGNGAVAAYRYQISTNTWTLLTPTTARAGAPNLALSAHWVSASADPQWSAENAIMNGRYIYSFRGGSSAALDQYDIALNTWSVISYSPITETFTTGTKYTLVNDELFIQKDATGRWFKYKFVTNEMDPWGWMQYPNGTGVVGDTCFDVFYKDGTTYIRYVYMILNTSTVMLRQMII